MTFSEVTILAGALALTARTHRANLKEGAPGAPVRLLFDRRETGDCSSRVVVPDLARHRSQPYVSSVSTK